MLVQHPLAALDIYHIVTEWLAWMLPARRSLEEASIVPLADFSSHWKDSIL